jgi:hypothetical protein
MSTKRVDQELVDRIVRGLRLETTTNGSLITMETFGERMIDEASARLALVEGKAVSLIGWSSALLGLLLLNVTLGRATPDAERGYWYGLLIGAKVLTIISLACASWAARATEHAWPEVLHWFCESQFTNERDLRVIHLRALLQAYMHTDDVIGGKDTALVWSQRTVGLATLAVGLYVLIAG